eukprot:757759-Pelagomonas_calceolata.AAC.4
MDIQSERLQLINHPQFFPPILGHVALVACINSIRSSDAGRAQCLNNAPWKVGRPGVAVGNLAVSVFIDLHTCTGVGAAGDGDDCKAVNPPVV